MTQEEITAKRFLDNIYYLTRDNESEQQILDLVYDFMDGNIFKKNIHIVDFVLGLVDVELLSISVSVAFLATTIFSKDDFPVSRKELIKKIEKKIPVSDVRTLNYLKKLS